MRHLFTSTKAARQIASTDEDAAILVLRVVARDPSFVAPPWMRELFAAHREALDDTFHRPDYDRETDFSEPAGETLTHPPTASHVNLPPERLRAVAELAARGDRVGAAKIAGVRPEAVEVWEWSRSYRAELNAAKRRLRAGPSSMELTG